MVEQLSIKAGDELLARILLQHVLGATVAQHDDGSAPSMYDLDIVYPDGRRAAAEVVSTRDASAMSQAAATQREVYTAVAALRSTWFVMMRPEAHVRTLRRKLPAILTDLERRDVSRVAYRSFESHQRGLADLGIAGCWPTSQSRRSPGFYLLSDWKFEWGGDGDDRDGSGHLAAAIVAPGPGVPARGTRWACSRLLDGSTVRNVRWRT
jgi:hypothetical protein